MTDSHRYIKNVLDRQIQTGRFPHAYLFVGPKGSGKKTVAMDLAKKLLGAENLAAHPDFSEFSAEAEASAESVREFTIRMGMKPFVAKLKFALMTNIENLTSQGANALLKTLEEPPENTVMVLTANVRKVLPTIFSRCQVFNFNRRGSHADSNADYPLKDLKISDYAGKSLAEKLLAINTFADLEETDLRQCIEDFIFQTAGLLWTLPHKYMQLAAGLKAYEDLDTNKNRKLILQGLMMKI